MSPTLAAAKPRLTGFKQGLEDKAVDAGEGSREDLLQPQQGLLLRAAHGRSAALRACGRGTGQSEGTSQSRVSAMPSVRVPGTTRDGCELSARVASKGNFWTSRQPLPCSALGAQLRGPARVGGRPQKCPGSIPF